MINILLEGRPIYNHDNHKTVILASLYFFSVEELMPSAQWTTLYSNVMTRYVPIFELHCNTYSRNDEVFGRGGGVQGIL